MAGKRKETDGKDKVAAIKTFKVEEADSLRQGVTNMRDLMNSLVSVTIRITDAHRRFHYLPTMGGKARTGEQDKRIQERAEADWKMAAQGALALIEHLEEETRAVKTALQG